MWHACGLSGSANPITRAVSRSRGVPLTRPLRLALEAARISVERASVQRLALVPCRAPNPSQGLLQAVEAAHASTSLRACSKLASATLPAQMITTGCWI